MFSFFALYVFTFLLAAFGHPSWVPQLGVIVAAAGYAFFWAALFQMRAWSARARFWLAFFWYAAVLAIHLSWMTSLEHMGPFMLVAYFIYLGMFALQFGFFSLFVFRLHPFGLAGLWTLMEWIRLFFLTGFSGNPAGLSLSCTPFSIQFASFLGIYGLTFWVILTNLVLLRAFFHKSRNQLACWLVLVLVPYGFGIINKSLIMNDLNNSPTFIAKIVDTGLSIEEKMRDRAHLEAFIPPLVQWERVWELLGSAPCDLIALPEGAFPYSVSTPFCPLEWAKEHWKSHYNTEPFPSLKPPFAYPLIRGGKSDWVVTNAFFAQTLANHYDAEVVVGLSRETREGVNNAAYHFRPGYEEEPEWYAKQILAPIGEYLPFRNVPGIASFIASEYGIEDFFQPGEEWKVFSSSIAPFAVPICLEEIHPGFVRRFRKEGASLLIGLSNDAWFPDSKLARQHFDHARLRAVENGVFFLRSTNRGIPGMVDCFGQLIASGEGPIVVEVEVPIFSFRTFYSYVGDWGIVTLSIISFLVAMRKKLLLNGRLR